MDNLRCAATLILLVLLWGGRALAQPRLAVNACSRDSYGPSTQAGPSIHAVLVVATIADVPTAALPDAPSATMRKAVPVNDAVRLPRSYRPQWDVNRSKMGDKLHYYAGSVGSGRTFLEAALLAGVPTLPTTAMQPQGPDVVTIASANIYQDQMEAYGDAMDIWRRTSEDDLRYRQHRLETGLATAESRQLLSNLALPVLLHQEARYRPAAIDAGLGERMANAAESIVLTHDDHGRLVPNYSKLVGTVGAAYLGRSLYAPMFDAPELNSGHFLTHYIAYSLAGDLATNVAHELVRAAIEPDVEVYNLHGRSTEDSYYPMSAGAKLVYWAQSTYAPRNFVQAILTADFFTITTQPVDPPPGDIETEAEALAYDQAFVEYGNEIQYWRRNLENTLRYHERRLLGGLAASETQMALQNLVVPLVFNMDPRYISLGSGHDAGARLGHAFAGLLITRTDAGGHTINLPVLVGTVGGALLAKEVYYPALGTPALESNSMFARTIGLNLVADALLNIRSEFFRHRGY